MKRPIAQHGGTRMDLDYRMSNDQSHQCLYLKIEENEVEMEYKQKAFMSMNVQRKL